MTVPRQGIIFLVGIIVFAVLVSVYSFSVAFAHLFELSVRLLALNGFLFLSIAAMMTPFLREVKKTFDRSFINVHHAFAAVGFTLITLHPIAYALILLDARVFVPNFQSWDLFWSLAGRQALIILYIALAASLVRRRIPKYWRPLHALTYVVLFFGLIHAHLLGTDFHNRLISVIFDVLFTASIVTFVLKRIQGRKRILK